MSLSSFFFFFFSQNVTRHSGTIIASMVGHVLSFQASQVPIAFARRVLKGKDVRM